MSKQSDHEELTHEGWLFLHPRAVPEAWRSRAIAVAFVPLLPHEARELLDLEAAPTIAAEDRPLVDLVASGTSPHQIAQRLNMTERTVYRKLARFRAAFGVTTTAELVARLSQRGFG